MPGPRVELLWWSGCPSTDQALRELRQEMKALGLDPAALEVREVDTDAQASDVDFVGSPTIRVNGEDIHPPKGDPVGLTCRIYRTRDGRVSPLPDRADVRDALQAAIERGDG